MTDDGLELTGALSNVLATLKDHVRGDLGDVIDDLNKDVVKVISTGKTLNDQMEEDGAVMVYYSKEVEEEVSKDHVSLSIGSLIDEEATNLTIFFSIMSWIEYEMCGPGGGCN